MFTMLSIKSGNLKQVFLLFMPVILLMAISSLIIWSIDPASLTKHLTLQVASLLIILWLSQIDYHLVRITPWLWYGLAIGLLLITLVSGQVIRDAARWITIGGISFQTSELAKTLLILYMAHFATNPFLGQLKRLLLFLLTMSLPIILIVVQPNLGTALLLAATVLAACLAAGAKLSHLAGLLLIGLISAPILFTMLRPYQQDRIMSFLNPTADPLGRGYNATQSVIAVGSGQLFGRGLGQGTQSHLRFLPEKDTDFIFASIVEELGLIGGLVVLGSYAFLTIQLIEVSSKADAVMGSMITILTASLLQIQVIVNIGMNMGIMPITGITLPFVSAGGSSSLSFSILIGICLSIAARQKASKAKLEIRA